MPCGTCMEFLVRNLLDSLLTSHSTEHRKGAGEWLPGENLWSDLWRELLV